VWIEGGAGVLVDVLHVLAQAAPLPLGQAGDLPPVQVDLTARPAVDAVDRLRQRRLSAAALADHAEDAGAGLRRDWITNEYEHNGLRADGERVLGRPIDLVKGRG
jgi:hypothetical protein